jgi:hypothetical protein
MVPPAVVLRGCIVCSCAYRAVLIELCAEGRSLQAKRKTAISDSFAHQTFPS